MASASASVIYVDLSSDSDDEQAPPGAKRRRLEQLQQKEAGVGQAFIKSIPAKLVNIPKASLPGGGALPSGLTVTKHNINKIPCNGNPMRKTLSGGGISGSNNKIIANNNNNVNKQVKSASSQNIAWSMTNKAPSSNVMMPSIPRHQVKVTPVVNPIGKPNLSATTHSPQIKMTPRPLPAVKLQKTLIVNKLPTLQNSSIATLQKTPSTMLPAQFFQKQQKPALGSGKPPSHNLKQPTDVTLSKTGTIHAGVGMGHTDGFTTKSLPRLTTTPIISNVMSTAARTLPFRSTSLVQAAVSPLITSMAASEAPPLRLLATPPHSAAALNEPLLLNLPPTTSITPQLTPTTTPPPASAPQPAINAIHQKLAKGSTFKLSSMPIANVSPVSVTVTKAKRVQPITVLKKSDEEWRKHVAEQQLQHQHQHQQQHQQQRQQQQQPSQLKEQQPTSTVVLVESPPTTPPTEKPESERARECATVTDKLANVKPNTNSSNLNLKKPVVALKEGPINPLEKLSEKFVKLAEKEQTKPQLIKDQQLPLEGQLSSASKIKSQPPPPMLPEYGALLKLCLEKDKSKDMQRLVEVKLMKYYYSVHENFVKSRGFRKMVEITMEKIQDDPDMIYVHLKGVIDELKVRRKGRIVTTNDKIQEEDTAPIEEPPASAEKLTVDKRLDDRIRKLNRTLYTITKRITALEEADVDWNDDDDSSYLQVERFKKRACQIYEKICDLTGESKSALRQLKQPFLFKDSPYPQFNQTLSLFVNRMQEFPDYHDVLRLLEHCNKVKDLGLANFEMKRIAHDAFVKVGRLLQARRKTDLYETVTHFTANAKDPAAADPELLAKLNENHKQQTKISDVLAKYAREQDLNAEEQREARLKEKLAKAAQAPALHDSTTHPHDDDDDKPCTSAQARAKAVARSLLKTQHLIDGLQNKVAEDNEGEDNSTSDDDSDEDEDVDDFVDNFKVNGEISDAESETEEDPPGISEPKTIADVIDDVPMRVKTAAQTDESMPNGKLKIMSVSSLNASLHQKRKDGPEKNQNENLKQISAEIVISDEES